MLKRASTLVLYPLVVLALVAAGLYTFYAVHVDDMPGYVAGHNWKFIPESKLPECIPSPLAFSGGIFQNEPCYIAPGTVYL